MCTYRETNSFNFSFFTKVVLYNKTILGLKNCILVSSVYLAYQEESIKSQKVSVLRKKKLLRTVRSVRLRLFNRFFLGLHSKLINILIVGIHPTVSRTRRTFTIDESNCHSYISVALRHTNVQFILHAFKFLLSHFIV